MADPRPPGPLIQLYCVPRDGAQTPASTGCSHTREKHWNRNQFCPNGSSIPAHSGPRSSAGMALNAALSRSASKSQKKGNFIEWTLSCAGRDVWERQEVGLFSITGVFLPRLQSRAFNPALDRRTSKSDACDSPQLLFLKQTT